MGRAQQFKDASMPPPQDWKGKIFSLSQDYPKQPVTETDTPWMNFDFKKQPLEYLMAVYRYALQGNTEVDWIVQNNKIRKWYHAPWMDYRLQMDIDMGREPITGLTRERDSRPHELSPDQETIFQNWAIGFYNPSGGYVIGQVWKDHQNPDASKATFPLNTVTAKIIYTEADSLQVPYLKDAPTTTALVYRKSSDPLHRTLKTLRLLQIDLAVKDPRAANESGWVMGTLFYQGQMPAENPWDRVLPVGVSWGNDVGITPENVASQPLHECYVNPAAKNIALLGWAGRVNGFIDNPNSSCISCHGAASYPMLADAAPDDGMSTKERLHWFNKTANTKQSYFSGVTSLDYSLQLATGIQNFYDWKLKHENRSVSEKIINRLKSWSYPPVTIATVLVLVGLFYFIRKKPDWAYQHLSTGNDKAILFLRILIGIIILIHGVPKIMGGLQGWIRLGQSLANFGIYWQPAGWGYMSAVTETLGGLLLITGLCFRPVGLVLCFNLLVAAMKHISAGQGLEIAANPLGLIAVIIFLIVTGPGKYSIDQYLISQKTFSR
ncbi:hypothetical protein BH11BAC2_BH11BAC2_07190 [soil metagenome]